MDVAMFLMAVTSQAAWTLLTNQARKLLAWPAPASATSH
jgi:hypothetical protein